MARTFNYGGRNGMSQLLLLVQLICKLYTAFGTSIIAFVSASPLTTPQKAQITDWLAAATAVCTLLLTLKVTYES